jgi:DNA modification methylase
MQPYYSHAGLEVYHGDVLDVLRWLPGGIVQTVVTSPPYWGLRDYGVPRQLGLEKTPEEFVAKMVEVFREVRRVLRDDGTLWLNMGDCYASAGGTGHQGKHGDRCNRTHTQRTLKRRVTRPGPNMKGTVQEASLRADEAGRLTTGLKPKDLVGIPWRLAFALQADGWYLRSDIIWAKPNPMPESVTDRPTKAHEYIFLLAKSERYFYDAEAIKEPVQYGDHPRNGRHGDDIQAPGQHKQSGLTKIRRSGNKERVLGSGRGRPDSHLGGNVPWTDLNGKRNKRSVWPIHTEPFPEAHFATFPTDIPRLCILAGTSEKGTCVACGAPWERVTEKIKTFQSGSGRSGNPIAGKNGSTCQGGGDTGDIRKGPVTTTITTGWRPGCKCPAAVRPCLVMDPFHGAGTSMMVAQDLGRRYIGVELNEDYIKMSLKRVRQDVLPLAI